MRDVGHCKMNPESIHLVDEFYDYSASNLEFLQRKFDDLDVRTKREVESKVQEVICETEEDEWEDCESEDDDEQPQEATQSEEQEEQYVLIRGYWHPLRDKIVDSKFIRDNLELNDKDEVVLKNGRILGHRKYAKYYKQNMVQIVRKKSELIRALTHRELGRLKAPEQTGVAKYRAIEATLER